jgi:hypothetical protein
MSLRVGSASAEKIISKFFDINIPYEEDRRWSTVTPEQVFVAILSTIMEI